MTRGILSASHVRPTRPITPGRARRAVRRRPTRTSRSWRSCDAPPATKHVTGSNHVRVYVRLDERTGRILAIGVDGQPRQGRRRPGRSRRSTSSTACPRRPGSSSSRSRRDRDDDRMPPIADLAGARRPSLPPVERRAPICRPASAPAAATAGIKASGRPDLALVVATAGPAAAAAVFTPNAFAAAPVRLSRAHLAATDPAGRAAGSAGRGRSISTSGCANAATGAGGRRRPGGDRAGSWRRPLGGRRSDGPCISRPASSARACRSTRSRPALAALVADGLGADDDGLAAAAEALRTTDSRDEGRRPRRVELPGRRRAAPSTVTVSGHRQGRRDDPSADGHDAVGRPDRRGGRPGRPARAAAPGRGADLGPAVASTATRAPTTPSSCSPRARRAPRRSARARRRGRDSGRRDRGGRARLARQQAADGEGATTLHHLPGHRRRATTPRPGPWPARSSPAAWSRPRSTAGTPTGAASRRGRQRRAGRAPRSWRPPACRPTRRAAAGGTPGRPRPGRGCGSRSPATSCSTARRAARVAFDRGGRAGGDGRAGDW